MQAQREGLDFIVIGAQKAGTTSLFQYLRGHPQILMPEEKERPYFSHDAVYRLGWQAYVEQLGIGGREAEQLRWGTVTPQYMAGAVFQTDGEGHQTGYDERTVPSRIHERLPDVRLIAILRDPVERAVSHHTMEVRRGREQRSFEQAVEELLEPDTLSLARRLPQERSGYIVRGEYGRILSGYLDVFAPEQLLVLFTDELERTPREVLRRIHEFIGVSPHLPENLGMRYGVNEFGRRPSLGRPASWFAPSSPLSPQALQRRLWRSSIARSAWRSLPAERRRQIGRRLQRLIHAAIRRQTAARWNQQASAPAPSSDSQPAEATLRRLEQHFAADRALLSELLGVEPAWRAAAASS